MSGGGQRDDLTAIAVLGFRRGHFGHFAFVHFFHFFDAQADRPAEVLHQNFGLFDLGRVDLAADHRTEGNARAEFVSDRQGQSR